MQDLLSQQSYRILSAEVQEKIKGLSWWQRHGMEWAKELMRAGIMAAGFVIFAAPPLWSKIIGMAFICYGYASIAISGIHEASHRSLTQSVLYNQLWGRFFSDFWVSQSSVWWHQNHVKEHHIYPNIVDREPQLFFYPWINKYIYFFILPYLLPLYQIFNSIKFLWGKWQELFLYLLAMALGWAVHIWVFTFFVSFWWAVACAYIMRAACGPLFMHLAVFNHIGLEHPRQPLSWLPQQTRTTRNLKPNFLLQGLGGNAFIECHVEHHLFPSISNHLLHKIKPTVKAFLEKEGFMYVEEPYLVCLKNCLAMYKEYFFEIQEAIKHA